MYMKMWIILRLMVYVNFTPIKIWTRTIFQQGAIVLHVAQTLDTKNFIPHPKPINYYHLYIYFNMNRIYHAV